MAKLHLILAFHNHQPVGNFDHVFEECYRKSYLPFLETIIAHPGLKIVLHYSGVLLSWMKEKHPEAIEILRSLAREGKVEILSGGFYEPILSVLPESDRDLQISELSSFIRKNLDYNPKGMWLAERVWEPQMPKYIARAGIEYLPIDDYHFTLTGMKEEDLFGYYISEDDGARVNVFPGSEKLRYFIPFRSVDEIFAYFREVHSRGGNPLLTMADDGEKFGSWPDTHVHCYENRWLDNFFTALQQNSDWIETTTFHEYQAKFRPLGMVYLPTASYREMGEWTLPCQAGLEYEDTLEKLASTGGDAAKRLLRGGIWRSFMVKYSEANHIHKRMCMISAKAHEAAKADPNKGMKALTELWHGQCNDAYWHGVFGGLYLPHLRSSLYRHLLKAESLAGDVLKSYPTVSCSDFNFDGLDEIMVTTRQMAFCATQKGGSLIEISLYQQMVNICDILSRRPEIYHAKITRASEADSGSAKTIHDRLLVKEEGLGAHLIYDGYRRTSLIDRFFDREVSIDRIAKGDSCDLGNFAEEVYDMSFSQTGGNVCVSLVREGTVGKEIVRIEKTIEVARARELKVRYQLKGSFSGLFAVEMNLSLLGSPLSLIKALGETMTMRSTAVHKGLNEFSIADIFLDLRIDHIFDQKIDLWHYPVETVSLSEQGIERLYQGTSFLFVVPMELNGQQEFGFTLRFGEERK